MARSSSRRRWRKRGVKAYFARGLFAGKGAPDEIYHDDVHLNPKGHHAYAEFIEAKIQEDSVRFRRGWAARRSPARPSPAVRPRETPNPRAAVATRAGGGARVNILGISALYHDSGACLVRDGEIVAAAQEERFTRKKHDAGIPINAAAYCLAEGKVEGRRARPGDVLRQAHHQVHPPPHVVLGGRAPAGSAPFLKAVPVWLKDKAWVAYQIESRPPRHRLPARRPSSSPSTTSRTPRAPSSPPPSRRRRSSPSTASASGRPPRVGVGEGYRVKLLLEHRFPHSLGLLYSAFTYFTGFKVNSGEYKLMGLAPYGEPVYADLIKDKLITIREDGSFHLDMSYFGYLDDLRMTNDRFAELFGGPARKPETPDQQARDGPGPLDPGGDRGDHAEDRPLRPRRHRQAEPLPGGRRGAQLRLQRQAGAERALRRRLGAARRGRRRRRARAPRSTPGTASSASRARPTTRTTR